MNRTEEQQFIADDEVIRITKAGHLMLGVITEDQSNCGENQVEVQWNPDSRLRAIDVDGVKLLDRNLKPGNLVSNINPDKKLQKGSCREIKIITDVQVSFSNTIIKNVDAERIFLPGDAVYLDYWVGFIISFQMFLVLRVPCGALIKVDSDHCNLKEYPSESMVYDFYPGQFLTGTLTDLSDFKLTRSTIHVKKYKTAQTKFYVQEIKMGGVYVQWVCKALSRNDLNTNIRSVRTPNECIIGKDLKRLQLLDFNKTKLNLFDNYKKVRGFLKVNRNDEIVHKTQWRTERANKYTKFVSDEKTFQYNYIYDEDYDYYDKPFLNSIWRFGWIILSFFQIIFGIIFRKKRFLTGRRPIRNELVLVDVILTNRNINVLWQNGSSEDNIPSTDLFPIKEREDFDFFPGDFVSVGYQNANHSNDFYSSIDFDKFNHSYGIVQSCNYFEKMAFVKLYTNIPTPNDFSPTLIGEEELSVYDLAKYNIIDFGDIVIRIGNFTAEDSTGTVGQVINNCLNGKITVKWIDGHISNCWLNDLFVVFRDLNRELNLSKKGLIKKLKKKTTEPLKMELELPDLYPQILTPMNFKQLKTNLKRLKEISILRLKFCDQDVVKELLAINEECEYFDKLANTNFFARTESKDIILSDLKKENYYNTNCKELSELLQEELIKMIDELITRRNKTILNLSEISQYDKLKTNQNNNFLIIEKVTNAQKYYTNIPNFVSPKMYHQAIARQHKILKEMPIRDVWIKAYEDRMDLLSVMIVGPKNTPYEDGLFIFDIHFDSNFPDDPPLFHYQSTYMVELNPVLKADGFVSLKILDKNEKYTRWNKKNTVAEVIKLIQNYILVSEPYFNDSWYKDDKDTPHGKENSRFYNEKLILNLIKSMTNLLSSLSTQVFRDEILQHFRERRKIWVERLLGWAAMSQNPMRFEDKFLLVASMEPPQFTLMPLTRGFCVSMAGLLKTFNQKLDEVLS